MENTIVVAIIGLIGTIVSPVISWYLTSKSKNKERETALFEKDKERRDALASQEKDHQHEIKTIKLSHEHEIKTKQQEFQNEIDHLKAQVEAENTKEQNTAITDIAKDMFQQELKKPNSELSKQMKQAMKESTRKHVKRK